MQAASGDLIYGLPSRGNGKRSPGETIPLTYSHSRKSLLNEGTAGQAGSATQQASP